MRVSASARTAPEGYIQDQVVLAWRVTTAQVVRNQPDTPSSAAPLSSAAAANSMPVTRVRRGAAVRSSRQALIRFIGLSRGPA